MRYTALHRLLYLYVFICTVLHRCCTTKFKTVRRHMWRVRNRQFRQVAPQRIWCLYTRTAKEKSTLHPWTRDTIIAVLSYTAHLPTVSQSPVGFRFHHSHLAQSTTSAIVAVTEASIDCCLFGNKNLRYVDTSLAPKMLATTEQAQLGMSPQHQWMQYATLSRLSPPRGEGIYCTFLRNWEKHNIMPLLRTLEEAFVCREPFCRCYQMMDETLLLAFVCVQSVLYCTYCCTWLSMKVVPSPYSAGRVVQYMYLTVFFNCDCFARGRPELIQAHRSLHATYRLQSWIVP